MKRLYFLFLISTCISAQEGDSLSTEFRENFRVTAVTVNGSSAGMTPFLFDGKLLFSRPSFSSSAIVYTNIDIDQGRYDIYEAERTDSVSFRQVHAMNAWNTLYSEGPVSVDRSGKIAIITSDDRRHNLLLGRGQQKQLLKLYISEKNNKGWTSPVIHPLCREQYSYFQGVMYDSVLLFCSDMPGGFGGTDIWYSIQCNGIWSEPRNMGASVNSSANELFPFVNSKGQLFFSSSRIPQKGLDIYCIVLSDTSSSEATLLESPVNSDADDFGIWTDSTGIAGYLSSGRDGSDKLFYFSPTVPPLHKRVVPKEKFCYTFYEEASLLTMDTVGITYEWDFGQGVRARSLKAHHCFPGPGTYPVTLNIVDKTSGEVFANELSYDFVVEEPHQLYIDAADSVSMGSLLTLCASRSTIDGFRIRRFYWIFDDGIKNTGVSVKHTFQAPGRHLLKLGVLAVNDSTNSEETFYTEKEIFVVSKTPSTGLIQPTRKPVNDPADFFKHVRQAKDSLPEINVELNCNEKENYVEVEKYDADCAHASGLQTERATMPER